MTNKTERPIRIEVNCQTGEELIVELTDEEIAELEERRAKNEADRITAEAEAKALADLKASARTKLVAGNKLTEQEAAVLVV